MCGRFTQTQSGKAVAAAFDLPEVPTLEPRYNIAPSQPVLAVTAADALNGASQRELRAFQWGLVPSWAKDPKIGNRMINARSETVAEKPSFRAAFKRRRCLIVADGFYEWQKTSGSTKQPFHIHLDDHRVFGFAGLWEHWESGDGSLLETCTILTTAPNELMASIHNRMPVILPADDYEAWLDPTLQDRGFLESLLEPYDADAMQAYPVSTQVNNPRHDQAECLTPLPTDA